MTHQLLASHSDETASHIGIMLKTLSTLAFFLTLSFRMDVRNEEHHPFFVPSPTLGQWDIRLTMFTDINLARAKQVIVFKLFHPMS